MVRFGSLYFLMYLFMLVCYTHVFPCLLYIYMFYGNDIHEVCNIYSSSSLACDMHAHTETNKIMEEVNHFVAILVIILSLLKSISHLESFLGCHNVVP